MEPLAFETMLSNCKSSHIFGFVLVLNCSIAFLVNLSNFMVTKCTSPLTLQVLGNAKVLRLRYLLDQNLPTQNLNVGSCSCSCVHFTFSQSRE